MKITMRILILLAGIIHLSNAFAQKNEALKITPLTGDFYVYVTYHDYKGIAVSANGMYLVTPDGVVLFDTPWDSTQFQPLLDKIQEKHGKKVVLCIATHSHEDRAGGLGFMNRHNIKTFTSEMTDKILQSENLPRAKYTFSKDTLFSVGGYQFEAYYPGEGHTRDNIVVWFGKEKILYGGCLIKSTEATDLGYTKESNMPEWTKTLQRLKLKTGKPKFIITGHDDWRNLHSIDHTLNLLRRKQAKKTGPK